jgi:hypothetical protein
MSKFGCRCSKFRWTDGFAELEQHWDSGPDLLRPKGRLRILEDMKLSGTTEPSFPGQLRSTRAVASSPSCPHRKFPY